jgi:hypothetical protein
VLSVVFKKMRDFEKSYCKECNTKKDVRYDEKRVEVEVKCSMADQCDKIINNRNFDGLEFEVRSPYDRI